MLLGFRAELDFLYLNDRLFLLGFGLFFTPFITEFAVIHDPANRRFGGRRNLHEIQTRIFGDTKSLADRDYPKLLALLVNNSYLFDPDLIIDARSIVLVIPTGLSSPFNTKPPETCKLSLTLPGCGTGQEARFTGLPCRIVLLSNNFALYPAHQLPVNKGKAYFL